MMEKVVFGWEEFDHLAGFGEWDGSDPRPPEDLDMGPPCPIGMMHASANYRARPDGLHLAQRKCSSGKDRGADRPRGHACLLRDEVKPQHISVF